MTTPAVAGSPICASAIAKPTFPRCCGHATCDVEGDLAGVQHSASLLQSGQVIECWPSLDLLGREKCSCASATTAKWQDIAAAEQRECVCRGTRTGWVCVGGLG